MKERRFANVKVLALVYEFSSTSSEMVKDNCILKAILATAASVLLVASTGITFGEQLTDPNFDAHVVHPAYSGTHPKVVFDEAHFNVHTTAGTYKPFVTLLQNDGYEVSPNSQKFSRQALKSYDILVIANALGARDSESPQADRPAFTENECDVVRDWVQNGGALLLITDHEPAGAAAENLGRRFKIEMSKGTTFRRSALARNDLGPPAWFLFSRDNNLLAEHPITRGRDASEHLSKVLDFTGQSLSVPPDATAFLKLGDDAFDIADGTLLEKLSPEKIMEAAKPARGRAQAIALEAGKGRVVVTGEAAMLTAAVDRYKDKEGKDQESRSGMAESRFDSKQLVLNILHWLSGALK
jgi:hypothetical protein